jgi:predicted ArsR family transcriptional regulator
MAEDRYPSIQDPRRLRALSHPLRWKLINLIDSEGTATATRCAEVLGESVASCSYHLNMLAKYAFIEEATGGQGREKPWRLTDRSQSFSGEGLGTEGQLAAEAASEAFLDFEFGDLKERLRRKSLEPEQWRKASGIVATSLYLTAEELADLRGRLTALADENEARWNHPELRPEGAREVRVFLATTVAPQRPSKN